MPQQLIEHSYYFGSEAEQYVFYRFPKALITNEYYAGVSDGAKILYGLMLDRMGLSLKNRWLDENGRVYIYFTLEDLQEAMHCGHNKGVKIMSELEKVGLIQRVKQGQGKPTIIYVKKFVSDARPSNSKHDDGSTSHSNMQNDSQGNHDFPKAEIQTSENGKSRLPECGSADFRKADTNKTKYSHNDSNDNNPIESHPEEDTKGATSHDGWDIDGISTFENHLPQKGSVEQLRRKVRRQIDYPMLLLEELPQDVEARIDEMVELMVETFCSTNATIRIAGDEYSAEFVKARFSQITNKHIWYVMECMNSNTTHVRNIKKYLLTALFNAPVTVGSFASAEYNHFSREGGTRDSNL